MFRLFADWYRLTEITIDGDTLEKRWQGVEAFLESIQDKAALLDLVRLFLGLTPHNSSFIAGFKQKFIDSDPLFPSRDNDFEIKVLAASAIAEIIENNKADNIFTLAQSIICHSMLGLRKNENISDVTEIADKFLSERSHSVRVLGEVSKVKLNLKIDQNVEELKKAAAANSFNQAWPNLESLLNLMRSQIVTAVNGLNKSIETLDKNIDVQREENDILWWIFGESSWDLGVKFSEIRKPGVCLVLAKELSDLTLYLPGPASARAFLEKGLCLAGINTEEAVSIKDIVNSSDRQWRERYMSDIDFGVVADFCPLHLALRKSLETDGEDDWIPSCVKAIGVNPSEQVSPLDASVQFYYEGLLIGSLAE